ncbi:amidohydrolase family protein [Massarina eburnea CBS 473.64]|uniref:6-methylsalicylate decarboxylase n=1 Tax=Massarina eburnea CBS 473.64 TaxID=1395130 RepID=A0A6A6RPM6_9PLEO|nr:amidohydrolase family protein [Massarina eburnea CBS 473.64]
MAAKIDVHHHCYPPAMTEALERAGGDPSGWYVPPWTPELDAEINHELGVRTAILSVTAPGPCIENESSAAAALARKCNDYCASVVRSSPSAYGFFASLPSLWDTKACLTEIAYALDTLQADGITLFTRYGPGHDYLGSPAFEPIWAELSRRKAVVFVHPTHPVDTALVSPALPQPMFDYPHETGRAAIDLLTSGTLARHPDCKIILSHAGGTLPYLIYRTAIVLPHTPVAVGVSADELVRLAKRQFWFDTAISTNPVTIKALMEFAGKGRILFGTDFPNAPREAIRVFTKNFEELGQSLDDETRESMAFKAAGELLPRHIRPA